MIVIKIVILIIVLSYYILMLNNSNNIISKYFVPDGESPEASSTTRMKLWPCDTKSLRWMPAAARVQFSHVPGCFLFRLLADQCFDNLSGAIERGRERASVFVDNRGVSARSMLGSQELQTQANHAFSPKGAEGSEELTKAHESTHPRDGAVFLITL